MTDPLLAPVGHYQGTLHGEQIAHIVRLGTQTLELDEAEHEVWLLAHGTGHQLFSQPQLLGIAGEPDTVPRLYERGLLAELPTGPDENTGFAANYRLEPTVHGLGNTPGADAARFRIGLAGDVWAELGPLAYEIWRWSAATRSLAEVCAALVAPRRPSATSRKPFDEADGPDGLDVADLADEADVVEQAVRLVAPLVTGWGAALQPAAATPLVGDVAVPLPEVEAVGPADALSPEDVLDLPLRPDRPDSPTVRVPRWEADPGHPGAAGWLFAVGHDGGPVHRPEDGTLASHTIRLGSVDHQLDVAEARLWAIARSADPGELWTRSAVAVTAVGDGLADAGRLLDGLIDRGVVVEVHPGTAQAAAFARRYRLFPLLHGLGTRAEDPETFDYGVPGNPVAGSTAEAALLWRSAGVWPTLWGALVALAGQFAGLGSTDPSCTDPEEFLTARAFHSIRDVLTEGVAYLDVAP